MAQKFYIDRNTNLIYRGLKSDDTKAVCMIPPHNHDVVDIDSLDNIKTYIAKQAINKAWDEHTDVWEYNGKKFVADKTLIELGDLVGNRFKGKCGEHKWPAKSLIHQGEYLKHKDGTIVMDSCWVGQFQGKLVTYNPYHYTPQAYAWEYDPNNEYLKGKGMGYIPMKHIKPVWNVTDKCWL